MKSNRLIRHSAALVLLMAVTSRATINIQTIATTGQSAPGVDGAKLTIEPSETDVGSGRAESLGPSGQVAFVANLTDNTGTTTGQGLWIWNNGSITLLSQTGQSLPSLPDETLTQFEPTRNSTGFGNASLPTVDASGRVGFYATTVNAGILSTAIFESSIDPTGTPVTTPVFRAGSVLSDDPRAVSELTFRTSLSGNYVIDGIRSDPAQTPAPDGTYISQEIIFGGRPGDLAVFAKQDVLYSDNAPSFSIIGTSGVTNSGLPVVKKTTLLSVGDGFFAVSDYAFYAATSSGALRNIASTGDVAPVIGGTFASAIESITTTPDGSVTIASLYQSLTATPSRGSAVAITAYAIHTQANFDPTYDRGIWLDRGDGNLVLTVLAGQPAPGTSQTFQEVDAASVNSNGDIAFNGDLDDPHSRGLWLWRNGALTKLAVVEDDPGTSDTHWINDVQLNDSGQILFVITGPEDNYAYHAIRNPITSIWGGPEDNPAQLLSLGDTYYLDGVPHIITALDMINTFNDAGQFVFAAQLDNANWGIYLATVPEPTTLLAASLLPLAILRRKH